MSIEVAGHIIPTKAGSVRKQRWDSWAERFKWTLDYVSPGY